MGTSTVKTYKHQVEMTPDEQQDAIGRAAAFAEHLKPLGEEIDRTGKFPLEVVPLYKDAGLADLAVPKRYGGQGADLWTTGQVSREIAKGDSSVALAFNMHQSMVGIFRGTPALTEEARERLMRSIATDRLLLCGPFSEARAGLSGLADTKAIPTGDGGWRLSGRKNWATLCEGSDLVSTNATITDAEGNLPESHADRLAAEATFIFPTSTPGVEIDFTWDTLGMRASGSHTMVFNDVHVSADAYGGNFRQGLIGEAEWAAVLFGGVYLGIAQRAYAETVSTLRKKRLGATASSADAAVKESGSVQFEVGRMASTIAIAERTIETTARMFIERREPTHDLVARKAFADLAKVAVTDAAAMVTDLGSRLVGGATFRRGHVLERLFRDARAGNLHSFGDRALYDVLGADALAG